jgi:hypothetical protein
MDATIPWLATQLPEPLALVIALVSLTVSSSAFTATLRDSAAKRRAHSRAAVSAAEDVLRPLVEFIRSPHGTEAKVVLATKPQWRELDKFATMAGRKTRRRGEDAVRALNDWEEAWRVYNYNPHTDERHASAKRAADVARERVAALTER